MFNELKCSSSLNFPLKQYSMYMTNTFQAVKIQFQFTEASTVPLG